MNKRANGEGSVYRVYNPQTGKGDKRHKKSPFCAQSTINPLTGRPYHRKFFATQEKANQQRKEWENLTDRNQPIPKSMTLERFIRDIWLPEKLGKGAALAQATKNSYENAVGYICPHLGHLLLENLRDEHITACLNKLSEKLADGVVAHTLVILRMILNRALQKSFLPQGYNPAKMVKWKPRSLKASPYEIDNLNDEQVRAYLNHLPSQADNADVLTFALGTGMRIAEVLGLRRSNVNLQDRFDPENPPEIEVTQQLKKDQLKKDEGSLRSGSPWYVDELKTKSSRRILPLVNRRLWEILHRRLADGRRLAVALPRANSERVGVDDLVFISSNHKPLHQNMIRDANAGVLKRAGLPYINIHRLRHTFSTLVRERGVEDWIVEKYLGHSLGGVKWTYNHAEKPLCQASAAMAEVMDGKPEEKPYSDLTDLSLDTLSEEVGS